MFIDTHAHLSDLRFDVDRYLAIKRAAESGVEKIIEVSCEPGLWKPSFEIVSLNKEVYGAFGLHPHEAKHFTNELFDSLKSICGAQKSVAVGETGLDYYYNHSPKEAQRDVFVKHIELAKNIAKPIVIHCREAYGELIEILKTETAKPGTLRGVIHCFSGTLLDAKELIDMGFYLGIDGPVTYSNAKTLRQVVTEMPVEKFLLETDSPYLTPRQHRGKRNEPSYIGLVAAEIAELKNMPAEKVAEVTTSNAQQLFNFI